MAIPLHPFKPYLLKSLGTYDGPQFTCDLIAGITMVSTFLLTVVLDLTVAVQVGMVLACFFFIYRVSSLTRIEAIVGENLPPGATLPAGVAAYRLSGSLFFGSVGKLEALLETDGDTRSSQVMILDMHHVINVDTTGLDTLDVLRKSLARRDCTLLLCDLGEQPCSLMKRAGFAATIGAANLLPDLATALLRAHAIVATPTARLEA